MQEDTHSAECLVRSLEAVHGSDSSASHAPAWHAQTVAEVLGALKSSPNGLSIAEVRKRLNQYGPNQIAEAPPPNPLAIVAHQFASPLIITLALAALAAGLLGEWIDAAVIVAALVINALFGFLQEWRAESAIRSLLRYLAPKARVLRDGREQSVDSRELVPGDIVLLESGVRVPADLRLLATSALLIGESVLTGESVPVAKRPDPVAADTPVAGGRSYLHGIPRDRGNEWSRARHRRRHGKPYRGRSSRCHCPAGSRTPYPLAAAPRTLCADGGRARAAGDLQHWSLRPPPW